MPVTAKLSRLFYERLGEEVTNELVDWLNQVDATYRADLRELNELNFARFNAKLEQRMTAIEARLEVFESRLEHRAVELRAELRSEFRQGLADLRVEFRQALADQRAELIRWMVGLWLGTLIPLGGLILALQQI